ncbi:MAG: TolC family protein [Synechococcaceae cyanobacterium RM1_1_27]|nr:TolC family protein [Synechococcaceae cyanobacterium RM1_1_27]
MLGRPASAQTEPLPLPAIEDPVLSGEETGEPEPSDLGVDPAIDQTEAMDPDTPASSPSATGVGLPTGEIVTPPLPPALVVPSGSEDSPPVGIPHLPGSAAELQAPQDPLQVRIEARQGLELEEALAIAVERNPDVRVAQLGIERAQVDVDRATIDFAPSLSSSGRLAYSQAPNLSDFGGGDSFNLTGTLIQLDYTFLDSGRRDSTLGAAQERLAIAELQLEQVEQSIKLAVATAYYDLQAADALVAINAAAVENSEASLRDAEARERAGLGTRFDVLQAETELANNRQQLIGSQNQQQQRQRGLAELLNLEDPTELAAIAPIEPTGTWVLSLEETIILAFDNRPELELQRRNFDLAVQQSEGALASTGPTVSGFAGIDFGSNLQDDFRTDLGYTAGATVNIPWFDGGDAQAQARGFAVDEQIAARNFEQTRNEIQRTVQDAFLNLSSSREQIDSAKTALVSAQESLRLARLRFQAGVGTQIEVINSESALTTALANLSDAIITYNRSLISLRRAVNDL